MIPFFLQTGFLYLILYSSTQHYYVPLFQIVGLATNTKFLDDLAGHREFEKANVHTGFIDQHYDVSSTSLFTKQHTGIIDIPNGIKTTDPS